jgi:GTP pyrophosphokinase
LDTPADNFEAQAKEIASGFDEKGAALIMTAFFMARKAHEGQKRMSGEPYVTHSLEVAKILKEMQMDAVTIAAGFLHDVIEDTAYTVDDIKKTAGENTAFLVEGVSHVTAKVFKTRGQIFSESLKKMFFAMAKDIRVIIIKLADRLHNMRTIRFLDEEKQKVISNETMNVYAPLAHRLGMEKVKSELEDISFAVLNQQAYRDIAKKIAEKKEEREKRIESLKQILSKELSALNIPVEIAGRPKHFYSIYQKMVRDNKRFENIYDLIALRVITDTVNSCYTILGIIHNYWKPLPGRFKDYIAMPKSNMYQSLHTTVLDEAGRPVEIQIRTKEMDIIAEDGIAAHWNYKEDKAFDKKTDSAFAWVRQLLEWHGSMRESEEFIKELKVDLFDEEVFVFTPQGEVKELIKGATVLDFAYSVHSDLGDKCIGAKVNGKWVTLKYEMQNGDRVDILKGAAQHPTIDWLKIAKTAKAKNRVRHWLRTNQNIKENIDKGTSLLNEHMSRHGIKPEEVPEDAWGGLIEQYNVKDKMDILAGIGYGEFSDSKVANYIERFLRERKEFVPEHSGIKHILKGEIIVQGEFGDISYKFAKCCNPVPGDEITGIFTKKGISVHRKSCSMLAISNITAPFVEVSWNAKADNYYMCKLKVTGRNRDHLVNDILTTIGKNNALITSFNSGIQYENQILADLSINVKGQKHLNEVMNSIRKVKDVILVERVD